MKIWKILTFFLIHLKPKAYHGKTGVAKKKLGTDTTGARIADGKVYYATYPEGGTHMNKMNVYRCDWNGKNNKLLFTQNVDDENGYIIPEEFTAKKITFAVSSEKLSGSEEDPVIEYVYDCTTEQITKVEK